MALALRILLWVVVLLVPGGVLALPLLVAQHTRKLSVPTTSEAPISQRQGSASTLA